MHQLKSLFVDAEKLKLIRSNTNPKTEIYISSLENKARDYNIFDLQPFYSSPLFQKYGMEVDLQKGVISKSFSQSND